MCIGEKETGQAVLRRLSDARVETVGVFDVRPEEQSGRVLVERACSNRPSRRLGEGLAGKISGAGEVEGFELGIQETDREKA